MVGSIGAVGRGAACGRGLDMMDRVVLAIEEAIDGSNVLPSGGTMSGGVVGGVGGMVCIGMYVRR